MGVDADIDITTEDRKTVLALLKRHLPGTAAWVYGSRVKWTSRPQSDLDVVVFTTPAQRGRVGDLREAFEESNLPFRVDLFVWDDVPVSFRRRIEAEHVVLANGREISDAAGNTSWKDGTESGTCQVACEAEATSGHAGTWPIMSLSEAGVSLIDCEHRTPPSSEHGYPYVGIPQVKDGRIDLNDVRHITPEHLLEWTRKANPQPFDIVLSRRCNPGETGFVPPGLHFALGQNLVLLRSDGEKVLKPFLRWLVRSPQWWTQVGKYINVGAVFDSLKCADIPGFRLAIAPLSEQRAIAHVLGTLDDKIELNRRMNATLEAMARALFESWFVDFDPVRAKMEGRDTGLPKDIADLFPDRLVESELGEIPESWPLAPLPELIEVNPPRPLRRGEIAPYLDMANMPTSGHAPDSVIERAFGSGTRFANGDTLMARITPCLENGKTAYVDFLRDDEIGWGSTEFIVMKSRPPVPSEFTYFLARNDRFREFAIQNMSGTSGRQRVPATALSGFSIPSPPPRVAVEFGRAAQLLLGRARSANHECRVLRICRDTLLPKLVSGDLRVTDTDRVRAGH